MNLTKKYVGVDTTYPNSRPRVVISDDLKNFEEVSDLVYVDGYTSMFQKSRLLYHHSYYFSLNNNTLDYSANMTSKFTQTAINPTLKKINGNIIHCISRRFMDKDFNINVLETLGYTGILYDIEYYKGRYYCCVGGANGAVIYNNSLTDTENEWRAIDPPEDISLTSNKYSYRITSNNNGLFVSYYVATPYRYIIYKLNENTGRFEEYINYYSYIVGNPYMNYLYGVDNKLYFYAPNTSTGGAYILEYTNNVMTFRGFAEISNSSGTGSVYGSQIIYEDPYTKNIIFNSRIVSVTAAYNRFAILNPTTKELTVGEEGKQFIIPVYREVSIEGTLNHVTLNANKLRETPADVNLFFGPPSEDLVVNLSIDAGYVITSVITVIGDYDPVAQTITYPSTLDGYIEDTVTINVESVWQVPSGNYQMTRGYNITESFTTDNCFSAYTIYQNRVFNINSVRAVANENAIYYNGWFDGEPNVNIDVMVMKDGSLIDAYLSFISIYDNTYLNKVSQEYYDFMTTSPTQRYADFYTDIEINVTTSEHSSYIVQNAQLLNTGKYFVFAYFYVVVSFDYGYFADTITSNVGTVINNTVTFDPPTDYKIAEVTVTERTGNFEITLYQNHDDFRVANKDLFSPLNLTGNLRDNCSIMTPVISVELRGVPTYNYAYIPSFNRYYYITNIVNIGWDLWELTLSCDVLKSFYNSYNRIPIFVERDSIHFNAEFVDNSLPLTPKPTITYTKLEDTPFNPTVPVGSTVNDTVLVLSVDNVNTGDGYFYPNTYRVEGGLKDMGSTISTTGISSKVITLVTDLISAYLIINSLDAQGLEDKIVGLYNYPFDILKSDTNPIGIFNPSYKITGLRYRSGESEIEISFGSLNVYNSIYKYTDYVVLNLNNINKFYIDNFMEYQAKYELFIPYHGWFELSVEDIKDKNIYLSYAFDLLKNISYWYLATSNSSTENATTIIASGECVIGKQLPVSTSNNDTLQRQISETRQAFILDSISGFLGTGSKSATSYYSAEQFAISNSSSKTALQNFDAFTRVAPVTAAVSLATNAIDTAFGAINMEKSISNMRPSTTYTISESNFGDINPTDIVIKITKLELLITDDEYVDFYLPNIGAPVSKVYTLNDYTVSSFVKGIISKLGIEQATVEETEEIRRLIMSGIFINRE